MKDALLDIVRAVSVVPFTIVKVTGNNGDVTLQSRLDDTSTGTIIFRGKLAKPEKEFDGIFGLANIPMLVGLTNVEAFRDKDAKVSVSRKERNGISIPEEIVFEKAGFGKANYRLTGEKAVPAQYKQADITYDVTIENPVKVKVDQFAQLAATYSIQETKFSVKTENRQLKFLIGDENASTHKAQFVFAENVQGNINTNHTWNIDGVLKVLKLGGRSDVTLKICNQGFLQIDVDTTIGIYTYIFAGSV